MDISVIVPIYGVEKYIEKCLRSLFTQTKTDGVEFILVNDATKDRSMELAREVIRDFSELTIKIVEHAENQNLAASRQSGIDIATGDYLAQIDSDDSCEPTMLERMYAKALQTNADVVICNYNVTDGVSGYIRECKGVERGGVEGFRDFFKDGGVNTQVWNKLARRSLIEDNLIKNDLKADVCQDVLWLVPIFYFAQRIAYVDEPLINYFVRSDSLSAELNNHKAQVMIYVVKTVKKFLEENNLESELADSFIDFKLQRRFMAIKSSRAKVQSEVAGECAEDNAYIFKKRVCGGLHNELAYWLAVHKCRLLANLIFYLVKKLKK